MLDPTINARYFHDDDAAREYLESIRWPDGLVCPFCPHGGSVAENYHLEGKAAPTARRGFLKKRADCREPKINGTQRTIDALVGIVGKRLAYRRAD